MIYHDGDVEKCRRDAIFNRVPFLEMKAPKIPSGEWPRAVGERGRAGAWVGMSEQGAHPTELPFCRRRAAGENPIPTAGEDPLASPAPPGLLPGEGLQGNAVGLPLTSLPREAVGRGHRSSSLNHSLGCPQVIYMARNPKDVVISYYYFYQMAKMHPDPGTLAEFLEAFMNGKGGGCMLGLAQKCCWGGCPPPCCFSANPTPIPQWPTGPGMSM